MHHATQHIAALFVGAEGILPAASLLGADHGFAQVDLAISVGIHEPCDAAVQVAPRVVDADFVRVLVPHALHHDLARFPVLNPARRLQSAIQITYRAVMGRQDVGKDRRNDE